MNFIFLRENEGMYQFGSKRVYLKINKGSIFVRVGGGFIDFEQFVDKYAAPQAAALEKFASEDKIGKKFKSMEKNKS